MILRVILLSVFFALPAFARDGVEMHFRGELNTKLVIYMRLVHTSDDSVRGDYMYLTTGRTVPLRGTIKNGKCNITEFSDTIEPTKPTGAFIGGFKQVEFTGGYKEEKFTGMWLSRDSSIFFRFELTRSGPKIETVKTRKTLYFEPPDDTNTVTVEVDAFAPKIAGDDKVTMKINSYLDSVMSEYLYEHALPGVNLGQENRFHIHYITNDLLSITGAGMDNAGGTHPNMHSTSITLNLKTGKPLKIKECFKPSALKKLNVLIAEAFRQCSGTSEDLDIVTMKPSSENFGVDAYQITFNYASFMRYNELVCGAISIPFKDLVPFIDPKGPFKIFLVLM